MIVSDNDKFDEIINVSNDELVQLEWQAIQADHESFEELLKKVDEIEEGEKPGLCKRLSDIKDKKFQEEPKKECINMTLQVPYEFDLPDGMSVEEFNKFKEEIEDNKEGRDLLKSIHDDVLKRMMDMKYKLSKGLPLWDLIK